MARLSRIGRGKISTPVGIGRALPRKSPSSSLGVNRFLNLVNPIKITNLSRSVKSGKMFDIRVKEVFFTSKKVIEATDAATRQVLSRFGAFVRQRARTSIRKRKAISEPGNPPSSHTGLLRNGIFFGYDITSRSVVVGPVPLRGRRPVAPPALEYGGTSSTPGTFSRTFNVRARPYMRPALRKELPGLPRLWKNSVKV